PAEACAAAMHFGAAGASAKTEGLGAGLQLAGGYRPRRENGSHKDREQRSLGNSLHHEKSSFLFESRMMGRILRRSHLLVEKLIEFSHGRIVEDAGPDLLHFSRAINQDRLWGEMKAVAERGPRVHLDQHRHVRELMLRQKERIHG